MYCKHRTTKLNTSTGQKKKNLLLLSCYYGKSSYLKICIYIHTHSLHLTDLYLFESRETIYLYQCLHVRNIHDTHHRFYLFINYSEKL